MGRFNDDVGVRILATQFFLDGILEMATVVKEYQSVMNTVDEIGKVLGQMEKASISRWTKFKDAVRFAVDAFRYKDAFDNTRGLLTSSLIGLLGYIIMVQGFQFQTDAAFIE